MQQSSNTIVLQVEALHVRYGSFQAVDNVSFDVRAGEIFGLLGPNGAGKTSTLSAIEGLLRPQSGNITVAGFNVKEKPMHARANLGVQLQATNFQPELTVAEILQLYAGIHGVPLTKEKLRALLADIKLEDAAKKRFGELSGGQQQRVSLVIAMIHNPRLLLLDEPTTGLDPQSRRQLWDIIRAFQHNGGTVLLTTHYMDEAERLCDRLVIVDHGQVIAEGTPADLIERLGGHHVVEFALLGNGNGDTSAWQSLPSVDSVRSEDGIICLNVREPHRTIPALLERVDQQSAQLQRLNTRQASLEDVFVNLTGRHLRDE